jgi:hypothetical protein
LDATAAVRGAATVTAGLPRAAAETVEREIARLTWSVLDGGASLANRQRLAALVNAQHAVRKRIDR